MKYILNEFNVVIQLILAVVLLVSYSCEDSRMHNMVDDKVYILKSGFVEEDIFTDNSPYHFYVVKSGITGMEAAVELVIDEEPMLIYNYNNNTNYKMLPEDAYTIESSVINFGPNDYKKSFPIVFNAEKIKSLKETNQVEYVLPCRIRLLRSKSEAEISDSLHITTIIHPNIKDAYVEFPETNDEILMFPNSDKEIDYYLKVHTTYHNTSDVRVGVNFDESLVVKYNSENNTTYKLLPELAYTNSLSNNSLTIPALSKEQFIKFTIKKSAFLDENGNYLFGDYIIPLQLTSTSEETVNEEKSEFLLFVSFLPIMIEKKDWQVIEVSDEETSAEDGKATNVIDGDYNTWWHSKYSAPSAQLPHHITLYLAKEVTLTKIHLFKKKSAYRSDTKGGEFYVSLDNETWTKLSDWKYADLMSYDEMFEVTPTPVRYLKIVFTESNRASFSNLAEVDLYGIY